MDNPLLSPEDPTPKTRNVLDTLLFANSFASLIILPVFDVVTDILFTISLFTDCTAQSYQVSYGSSVLAGFQVWSGTTAVVGIVCYTAILQPHLSSVVNLSSFVGSLSDLAAKQNDPSDTKSFYRIKLIRLFKVMAEDIAHLIVVFLHSIRVCGFSWAAVASMSFSFLAAITFCGFILVPQTKKCCSSSQKSQNRGKWAIRGTTILVGISVTLLIYFSVGYEMCHGPAYYDFIVIASYSGNWTDKFPEFVNGTLRFDTKRAPGDGRGVGDEYLTLANKKCQPNPYYVDGVCPEKYFDWQVQNGLQAGGSIDSVFFTLRTYVWECNTTTYDWQYLDAQYQFRTNGVPWSRFETGKTTTLRNEMAVAGDMYFTAPSVCIVEVTLAVQQVCYA